MKAKLKCRIDSVTRAEGVVTLKVSSASGKVDTKMPPAQMIEFEGTIKVKSVIGDVIQIGSLVVIDVETGDANESSDPLQGAGL
jgi:hypothetical protein